MVKKQNKKKGIFFYFLIAVCSTGIATDGRVTLERKVLYKNGILSRNKRLCSNYLESGYVFFFFPLSLSVSVSAVVGQSTMIRVSLISPFIFFSAKGIISLSLAEQKKIIKKMKKRKNNFKSIVWILEHKHCNTTILKEY